VVGNEAVDIEEDQPLTGLQSARMSRQQLMKQLRAAEREEAVERFVLVGIFASLLFSSSS
jgi:hypothetical protein